jgi:B12-binding domain/radical SAM domain protein
VRNPFSLDLVLLHAPSVFDFRERAMLQGPVADVIPSTDEFEMYPVGLTSLAAYLERNSYNVRIVNLAYRMLSDAHFDPERYVTRLTSRIFGIDLHWLPHANGALALAELIKRVHPAAQVLIGGLSSTYFHEELIRYPFVDLVLRGDSTEEPCRQLLHALRSGGSLDTVENLTWKRGDGSVVVNPTSFVPDNLDYVDVPDYRYVLRSVFKYRSLRDMVPYLEWLRYPSTMILNARGCTLDCAICGGSASAYALFCHRSQPAFRSPEKLIQDIRTIRSFTGSPIFMVHDPRMGGQARADHFFDLLSKERLRNEFVFELFYPADSAFFEMVQRSVPAWSLQMTIETQDERLRENNGKFVCSNEQVEQTLAQALSHGCRKLDMFFMVGVPGQSAASAMQIIDYCEHLLLRFKADPRLHFFVAPLGPFLDPGSRAFEDPQLGYKHLHTTLEEHRQALLEPSWRDVLSYESDVMDRDEIVETSYALAGQLNELKFRNGLIGPAAHELVASHLKAAHEAIAVMGLSSQPHQSRQAAAPAGLQRELAAANTGSMNDEDEMKWQPSGGIHLSLALLRGLGSGFIHELVQTGRRLAGRYDGAVYTPSAHGHGLRPLQMLPSIENDVPAPPSALSVQAP